ncbi:hypothetical protein LTR37_016486 [Vermiconidia calcicola]|uniref:Uncharacterized protein n=1 Tax=Vermiconidia calcicola TaxID=1690605 RepID=A0ACC3MPB4_9PEZI|nr:hypothetical protein LTR37_016486 [Vermiconidia calcicola]
MASGHLSNDEFFAKLASLLEKAQKTGHGSVHFTQKRMTYDTDAAPSPAKVADDPLWDLNPPKPLPLIVRATDGESTKSDRKTKNPDKVKLSTIVQPDDLETFFTRYAEVCKTGMQSLKKRDRSKRKKDKGKKKKSATGEEKKG